MMGRDYCRWGKALILRNTTMLWGLSIAFELMELTFQHMLPNFNECWWDSWILDVAVCNFIGAPVLSWGHGSPPRVCRTGISTLAGTGCPRLQCWGGKACAPAPKNR
jgi:Phosphatidyl serine synthase